jgi:Protein of unknown function (DUF2637)
MIPVLIAGAQLRRSIAPANDLNDGGPGGASARAGRGLSPPTEEGTLRNRTGWQYALAGLFIASIAAVISYNDGLFVARLAGNHDRQAFLYPLLPDGLIVVCLLALVEGARMRPAQRSGWATCGLVLGIGMTLAMNAGAGVAHSVLDAVIDGLVPVVFFIAVEVVLWHVRRGRAAAPVGVAGERSPAGDLSGSPATITETARATEGRPPSEWLDDQIMALLSRMSVRTAAEALGVSKTRVETAKRRAALAAADERSRGGAFPGTKGGAPAAQNVPAGDVALPQPAPAGAFNGQAAHG